MGTAKRLRVAGHWGVAVAMGLVLAGGALVQALLGKATKTDLALGGGLGVFLLAGGLVQGAKKRMAARGRTVPASRVALGGRLLAVLLTFQAVVLLGVTIAGWWHPSVIGLLCVGIVSLSFAGTAVGLLRAPERGQRLGCAGAGEFGACLVAFAALASVLDVVVLVTAVAGVALALFVLPDPRATGPTTITDPVSDRQ